MNKLISEFYRLFFFKSQPDLPKGKNQQLKLVSADGDVLGLVISIERAADWSRAAICYQGLQEDLEFPSPGMSVSGRGGYQLWLPFSEAMPVSQVEKFVELVRLKYFSDLQPKYLRFCPVSGDGSVGFVPAIDDSTGRWSAFIDPTMGAMFMDEPGLELAPNMDRQADMLACLEPIDVDSFEQALSILQDMKAGEITAKASQAEFNGGLGHGLDSTSLNVSANYTDPKGFLLAVMNDSSISFGHRIDAAKALLPYFEK